MDLRIFILSAFIILGSFPQSLLSAETVPVPADVPLAAPTPAPDNAAGADTSEGTFASDEDRLDGDHLKLRVNAYGFEALKGPEQGVAKCAPKGSKIVVVTQVDDHVLARVKLPKAALVAAANDAIRKAAAARGDATIAREEATKATLQASQATAALKSNAAAADVAAASSAAVQAANAAVRAADAAEASAEAAVPEVERALKAGQKLKVKKPPGVWATEEAASLSAISACVSAGMVNDYTAYRIEVAQLVQYPYRRTGVMFGALVVPFKFHMGGENKLSASSTVAPYIGFRGPAPFGLTFTPIVSAGLGLVPVNDPSTDETDTKSAFSFALGVLLTHSKNDKFNAGVLFGKDFLSKSDRVGDDTVDKVWFSIYVGYKL
jgi:hypothetical protein